ncbi:CBS domain-containing protein [Streptomyces narbonensis]|uniref:CBS domain-containing protein n=1 Tax=Streptomyces narbonensis TaxID=67333 RepID=A0ABV3C6G8_9ACTN
MTTAREIMHAGAHCVRETENLMHPARRMNEQDVGALPICGPDDRLHGVISEADLARHLPEERVGHFVEEICR